MSFMYPILFCSTMAESLLIFQPRQRVYRESVYTQDREALVNSSSPLVIKDSVSTNTANTYATARFRHSVVTIANMVRHILLLHFKFF